jgi:hypothetical protein
MNCLRLAPRDAVKDACRNFLRQSSMDRTSKSRGAKAFRIGRAAMRFVVRVPRREALVVQTARIANLIAGPEPTGPAADNVPINSAATVNATPAPETRDHADRRLFVEMGGRGHLPPGTVNPGQRGHKGRHRKK